MNRYLGLFRFGNGLMGIIGIAVGGLIAAGTGIADAAAWVALGCLVSVTFIAGGNALNDYIDRDIDKEAHPERPIPSGQLKAETARALGVGMLLFSALLSLIFGIIGEGGGWITTAMILVCIMLMFSYEVFLKQRGFIGNVDIAFLTAMVFIVGGSIGGDAKADLVFAAMAFLVSVGREISKDIEDEDSDKGRFTLPMRIGSEKAATIAGAFFVLGPVLSVIPAISGDIGAIYCLIALPDAIFLYCAYIVRKDAHKAQKLAKIAMLAALIAFVLDVII